MKETPILNLVKIKPHFSRKLHRVSRLGSGRAKALLFKGRVVNIACFGVLKCDFRPTNGLFNGHCIQWAFNHSPAARCGKFPFASCFPVYGRPRVTRPVASCWRNRDRMLPVEVACPLCDRSQLPLQRSDTAPRKPPFRHCRGSHHISDLGRCPHSNDLPPTTQRFLHTWRYPSFP